MQMNEPKKRQTDYTVPAALKKTNAPKATKRPHHFFSADGDDQTKKTAKRPNCVCDANEDERPENEANRLHRLNYGARQSSEKFYSVVCFVLQPVGSGREVGEPKEHGELMVT